MTADVMGRVIGALRKIESGLVCNRTAHYCPNCDNSLDGLHEAASEALQLVDAMGGEDGWLPIETAPKDGTRVLLRFDAELLIALRNALPTLTTALREAARMREAEKITLMLASFKDPRTVSCPDEELELFAKIIEDAKAIHGDLHEDEEPGHGA